MNGPLIRNLILLAFAPVILSGCGLAAGAGATAGIAAAQEGGLTRAWSDAKIQTAINDLWFRHDFEMFRKIDMTVHQGRVLLTGVVQNPEHRVEAVRLAWQPDGVKQVINEIRVADNPGLIGIARDNLISARLRTAITFDRNVQSINYSFDAVQGVVYVMGIAQSQAELNRVIEIARSTSDVKQVVSYVKFAGDNQPDYRPPDSPHYVPPQGYESPGASEGQASDLPPVVSAPAPVTSEPISWNEP